MDHEGVDIEKKASSNELAAMYKDAEFNPDDDLGKKSAIFRSPSLLERFVSTVYRSASIEQTADLDMPIGTRPRRESSIGSLDSMSKGVPTWDQEHTFSFPVKNIKAKHKLARNLYLDQFDNIQPLAMGSHATLSLAQLHGEPVVIKTIKEADKDDPVAIHEFEVEHGLLARINHPNIVKILGSGRDPLKFIVLQFLGGGTMRQRFDKSAASKTGFSKWLSSSKTFTFKETLERGKELANALEYLHVGCDPEATLIHRDLKPDNIAFLLDGSLMLFDLGLCTIVKRCATVDTVYEMTGGTGSLRYMAPEVALKKPYNEKVDQYSFAVILWQMAKDELPYAGASVASYIQYACKVGERPELPSSWPKEFRSLLSACWHQDLTKRPPFSEVGPALAKMIEKTP